MQHSTGIGLRHDMENKKSLSYVVTGFSQNSNLDPFLPFLATSSDFRCHDVHVIARRLGAAGQLLELRGWQLC